MIDSVLVVQRVRIVWTARGRGAVEATARGRLPNAFPFPRGGSGQVLVHEVLMREADGYARSEDFRIHDDLSEVDWLRLKREPDGAIRVERRPVWASYPISRRIVHICTLEPGQSARYQANFRLSGYSMEWTYDDWTINIAREPPRADLFLGRKFDFERDDRVSLYGKPAHR
ncbi:hypothetical protein OG417_48080 [Actinoallomurus sp. NBC_01490]|uniref:hypothetical protein n=1 Tax=Actinoallomurus sp. NBC_01490 TaxID=2903557 RepID=UPI002E301F8D|nr:hypothetical protein [Actinoallomurus sp. NBC_01490]